VLELRRPGPLVELRLLRHRTVALTNLTAFMAGVALYMFLPLLTDFVQIDRRAGYGLGASVAVTGLMLVPFSVLSASMSRVARIVGVRIGEVWVVPIGAVVSAVAAAMIAVAGGQLWEAFFATGLAGVGVGFTFAAMPGLIVRSVPAAETGSALGFYQVVRFLGFTFGAAVTASLLAAYTRTGTAIPTRTGFTVAFVCSAAINLAAAGLSATVGRPGRLLPGSVPDAAAAGVVVD
jgi:MFS family permease